MIECEEDRLDREANESEQKLTAWSESYAALGADRMIGIWLDPATSESTRNDYTAFVQIGYGFEGLERFIDVWNASPWTCGECGFIGNNGEYFMSDCSKHKLMNQTEDTEEDLCTDCGEKKCAVNDLSACRLCELTVCENCSETTKGDAVYCLDCYCLR